MGALRTLFIASLAVAALGEGWLQVSRPGAGRDPSYVWMLVGSFAGIALEFTLAGVADLPGPRSAAYGVGLVVMWSGMLFRAWSVRTLGRFFNVTVGVEEDQQVVDTGPYALVRHPSYTGILTVYLGIGIALNSWWSIAAVLLPAAAVINRMSHEERALTQQLPQQYGEYARRTKRLIPGIW